MKQTNFLLFMNALFLTVFFPYIISLRFTLLVFFLSLFSLLCLSPVYCLLYVIIYASYFASFIFHTIFSVLIFLFLCFLFVPLHCARRRGRGAEGVNTCWRGKRKKRRLAKNGSLGGEDPCSYKWRRKGRRKNLRKSKKKKGKI